MRTMIVDAGFPHMARLAAGLAEAKELDAYWHSFLDKNGSLRRGGKKLPIIGGRLANEFDRRQPPESINPQSIHLAGTALEILRYTLHHARRITGWDNRVLGTSVRYRRDLQLSKAAVSKLGNIDAVIASYGAAIEVFQSEEASGVLKVLDYPIAYHQYATDVMEEDFKRRPDYKNSFQAQPLRPAIADRFDRETELADIVLVGSEFVLQTFVRYGVPEGKIRVVPYGADLEMFSPTPSPPANPTRFDLLFVGQISQRKGIADLLDAYRLIRTEQTSLRVVGNFVGPESVFSGSRDLFQHTPHVKRDALPRMYQAASAFVLPSLIEGMPLVVLEAMASGLPVVVTDRGGDQIVRDGIDGFVVPAGDVDALADRLAVLRDDQGLRTRMGASAALRAQDFSWSSYTNGVRSVLQQALDVKTMSLS